MTETGFWQSFDAHGKLFDNGKFPVLWKSTDKGWKMYRDFFGSNRDKKTISIMENHFENFLSLHHAAQPLLIGNVWDVQSAQTMEKLSFRAIATSSAAVAATLGYDDGEQMSFEDYLFVIRHIRRSTSLPLSVDLEAGYGEDAESIVKNLIQLAGTGVVGVNIEDSIVLNGKRSMMDVDEFADRLVQICNTVQTSGIRMFINVRCDAFLLPLPSPLASALERLKLYEATGAHGLFFPCITSINDIAAITGATQLPVNVMCMPGLPDFAALKNAGVRRISMGNFLHRHMHKSLEESLQGILTNGNFSHLF